jgi:hypothetical protein
MLAAFGRWRHYLPQQFSAKRGATMAEVYPSKIDNWLKLTLIGSALVCAVAFIATLLAGDHRVTLITLSALLLGAGLPLWLMNTRYVLSDTTLLVRSGPFRWVIPLRDIEQITATSNPLSSPALSLDRLRIDYSRGRSVMISPLRKTEFLDDLQARRSRCA